MKSKLNPFLALILFCSTVLVLVSCSYVNGFFNNNEHNEADLQEIRQLREELNQQKSKLQSLAMECGVSESSVESSSALGLISEIKIKLDDMIYTGSTLTDEDMLFVKNMLSDEPRISKTVQAYDFFIKKNKKGGTK